jgi:hypothetical protein
MVFTYDVADHARRFFVRLIVVVAQLIHSEEHPAVDRLKTVSDIRQSATDDNTHGVVHVGLAHFVFNVDSDSILFGKHLFFPPENQKRAVRIFSPHTSCFGIKHPSSIRS